MSLHLYRRHQSKCETGRPEHSRTGEFEELKKGWKRCACLIFASGTLARKFRRQSTGQANWDDAKTVSRQWEAAASWTGTTTVPIQPSPASGVELPHRTTIEKAVKTYMSEFGE